MNYMVVRQQRRGEHPSRFRPEQVTATQEPELEWAEKVKQVSMKETILRRITGSCKM
jgi:hypothetical protein